MRSRQICIRYTSYGPNLYTEILEHQIGNGFYSYSVANKPIVIDVEFLVYLNMYMSVQGQFFLKVSQAKEYA